MAVPGGRMGFASGWRPGVSRPRTPVGYLGTGETSKGMENNRRIGATVKFKHTNALGALEKFELFHSSTYNFKPTELRALKGSKVHFKKALTLIGVAKDLLPKLDIDEQELRERGFTPADNADRICTLVEAAVMEVYSSLDCVRSILVAVFRSAQGMPTDSTRRFFERIQDGVVFGAPFPMELNQIIRDASWFPELRKWRDSLTHLDTGFISRDKESKLVSYFRPSLKQSENALQHEDIFAWLESTTDRVNRFLGSVFSLLLGRLSQQRVNMLCGFVDGRLLMRSVTYDEETTGVGGECGSAEWFELPENPTCPFSSNCPVYASTKL
jgi:hypothetical protein